MVKTEPLGRVPESVLYGQSSYVVRRKILTLLGAAFHVYGPDGSVLFYSRMKAFKLKEDIRLYTGEDMQQELLAVKARQILDFSAAYDVVDSLAGTKVGALKRKGLKSLVRDEWIIMDAADTEIGVIREDSLGLALVRRLLTNLVPQRYEVQVGDTPVARFRQNFNPFVLKLQLDFTPDVAGRLDRRLGLAAAILLCAIEGRQE
jgi:uncharacterized protein YxjI